MTFEYSVEKTFKQSIDVVDIGNMALRCTSSLMQDYYLITKTVLGKTSILKFGPISDEIGTFLEDFTVSYKKINYKELLIKNEVNKFINDFKKEIYDIEEITDYELWKCFPNIQEYFELT